MLQWWAERHWTIRMGIPICLLLISLILLLSGRIWLWGWIVGFVLLAFGGPDNSEKNGFRS